MDRYFAPTELGTSLRNRSTNIRPYGTGSVDSLCKLVSE